MKDAAYDIKLAIKEKCGISLDIVDEREIDGQKAICVGALSRDTVTPLAEGLGYHDYVIAVSGARLAERRERPLRTVILTWALRKRNAPCSGTLL